MSVWESLLQPPSPAPINFIEGLIYLGFVLACFRSRNTFSPNDSRGISRILWFCCAPLVVTCLFGFLHAWSIFSFSEIHHASLRQMTFLATYNLGFGLTAFAMNAIVTFRALKAHRTV